MSTKTQTIKASEIRVNDTITYCGATFTVERMTVDGDLLTITPADGGMKQVIWAGRDVEVTGKRGYKVANVHYNRFADAGTVTVKIGERTRGQFQMAVFCGNKSNAVAFASTPELITCDRCSHGARYGR